MIDEFSPIGFLCYFKQCVEECVVIRNCGYFVFERINVDFPIDYLTKIQISLTLDESLPVFSS